jgi:hypothetical protein
MDLLGLGESAGENPGRTASRAAALATVTRKLLFRSVEGRGGVVNMLEVIDYSLA